MMITIENYQDVDFERCLEIRIQNYKEVNKRPQDIPGTREHFLNNLKTRTYFVAKDGDLVVGIGGYYENHLSTFFVDPKYQGQGIGRLLLQKVLSEIQKLGYKDANLNSSEYAKNFYERFGFVVVEKKKDSGYVMEKVF